MFSPTTSDSFASTGISSHGKRHSSYDSHPNNNHVTVSHHAENSNPDQTAPDDRAICKEQDQSIRQRIERRDKHVKYFPGVWAELDRYQCSSANSQIFPLVVAVLFGVSAVAYMATRFGWERLKRAKNFEVTMPAPMVADKTLGLDKGNGSKHGGPFKKTMDISPQNLEVFTCGTEQEEGLLDADRSHSSHSSGDDEGRSNCDVEAAMDTHEHDDDDQLNTNRFGSGTLTAEVETVNRI